MLLIRIIEIATAFVLVSSDAQWLIAPLVDNGMASLSVIVLMVFKI